MQANAFSKSPGLKKIMAVNLRGKKVSFASFGQGSIRDMRPRGFFKLRFSYLSLRQQQSEGAKNSQDSSKSSNFFDLRTKIKGNIYTFFLRQRLIGFAF